MSKELFVEEGYNGASYNVAKYYDKDAVDALLAKKDKEIESLKASHYEEMVDAGMRERRLRRALWLARADRAKAMYTYWHVKCIEEHLLYEHKWIVVERLCRSKAEEYKR